MYIQCIGDGEKIKNGGYVRTKAKTDKGILRAARVQIWSGSPAALCGYKLVKILVDEKREISA